MFMETHILGAGKGWIEVFSGKPEELIKMPNGACNSDNGFITARGILKFLKE
jgi:hypothetical protein